MDEELSRILAMIDNPVDFIYEPPFAYEAALKILRAIERGDNIAIDPDIDVDGGGSLRIVVSVLRSLGHYNISIVNKMEKRHGIDGSTQLTVAENDSKLLIILDSSSDKGDDIEILSTICDVIIIDHHKISRNAPKQSERVVFINSTTFTDSPYKSMSAGLLTYLVLYNLMRTEYQKDELASIAYMTVISDSIAMDSHAIISFMESVRRKRIIHPFFNMFINDFFTGISREFISFTVAPRLNACYRHKRADIPLKLLVPPNENYNNSQDLLSEMESIYRESRETTKHLMRAVDIEEGGEFLIASLDSPIHKIGLQPLLAKEYTGLVANEITRKTGKPTLCFVTLDKYVKGSLRDKYGRQLLNLFTNFINAGGHQSAFGFEDTNVTFQKLISKLEKLSTYVTKDKRQSVTYSLTDADFEDEAGLMRAINMYSKINELGESVINVFIELTVPKNAVIKSTSNFSKCTIGDIELNSFSGELYKKARYVFKPCNNKLIR